ncbi:MAG: MAC/perforin domain-containing protein [Oscillospiraceae bacterium]|nr:MAC/perforin domain-containing protein [Oscillospiraceae bacterium]MDD3832907.1 MAC/perforin domain-containing protein [Oscillospiraceae bacterium]MDD4402497.1 MAC/perforin domain-containing protein [Desulfitobacteriaceae bacterium]
MISRKISAMVLVICMLVLSATSCKKSAPVGINPKQAAQADQLELAGAMGETIKDEYGGYLGYGYNVVTSAYFNSKDVSSRAEILDTDLLLEDRRLRKISLSHTDTALYMGETLESYQKDVSANLGLSFSYGLFSKVKGDFSLSANTSTSGMSKSVFIKNQIKIQKERQFIKYGDLEMDELKGYVYKTVLNKINADISGKTAEEKQKYYDEEIFDRYGTHLLMDIMLGGRMDLNYVYNNTSKKSMQDIKMELDATYKTFAAKVSGSISTEISTKSESFAKNSTFTASRVGGSVSPDINTYERALDTYKDWSQSIQDGTSLEFFDVGNTCQDSLLPIWEFADSDEKRTEIILAYEKYVSKAGQFFADLDKSIGKETMPLYIKNIYIGSNPQSALAKSNIDTQIAINESDFLKKVIVPVDLNKSAGGDYIYIGYTMTPNPDEAIRDIKIEAYTSSGANKTKSGYSFINSDLNKNSSRYSSSVASYIYLYYTKDKSKGEPIREIGIEVDGVYSFGTVSNGWIPSLRFNSNDKYDCNRGVADSAYIYIWFKR